MESLSSIEKFLLGFRAHAGLLAGQWDLPLTKDRVSSKITAQHLDQADGNSAGAAFSVLTRGVRLSTQQYT